MLQYSLSESDLMFMSTRGLKLYRCLQPSLLINDTKAHTGAVDIGSLAAVFSIWPRVSFWGATSFPKSLGVRIETMKISGDDAVVLVIRV